MTIAFVQQVQSNLGQLQIDGVLLGNALVFQQSYRNPSSQPNGSSPSAPVDTNGVFASGNVPVGQSYDTGSQIGTAAWNQLNAPGGTHKISPWVTTGNIYSTVSEFSGISQNAALDKTATAATAESVHTSQVTGTTASTTQNEELVIIGLANHVRTGGGVTNIGLTNPVSGFTTLGTPSVDTLFDIAAMHAYKIIAAMGAQSATFNWTNNEANQASQAIIMTLKGGQPAVIVHEQMAGDLYF